MAFIEKALNSIRTNADTIVQYAIFIGILVFGFLLLSSLFKFIFKKSQLNLAVSSAVEILCLYVINIVIYSLGLKWNLFLSPLPFVALEGDMLTIFSILSADLTVTCGHILRILIIAFVVNIANNFVPKGKHLLSWYFFRLLTVVAAVGLNYLVDIAFSTIIPESIMQIAPTILLGALAALILLGSLKLIAGVALSFANPIIGALYTFFFSNLIGKQLARALVTTALLTGLVVLLDFLQFTAISIAATALVAYIPLLAIVLVLWYILGHIL